MDETLLEYADCRGMSLKVDRDGGILRGVKILGLESRNGRSYAADAVARARELYEGAKVNVNHPKGNPAAPRDYQDRLGVIRNVTHAQDVGLFGDLHFNPRHTLAEQLQWDAENAPENVGLSHNVLARTSRRENRVLVESITRVLSVDLVADPATTHGLFVGFDGVSNDVESTVLQTLTAETLLERRRDLVDRLLQEEHDERRRLQNEVAEWRKSEQVRRRRAVSEAVFRENGFASTSAEALAHVLEEVVTRAGELNDEPSLRRWVDGVLKFAESASSAARAAERRSVPLSREQRMVEGRHPPCDDMAGFVRAISRTS